jgi:hypothetical protein
MTDESLDVERIWERFGVVEHPKRLGPLCGLAMDFRRKIAEILLDQLPKQASRGQIAQGKLLLQDEYFAWKRAVPEEHRREQDHAPHHCLEHVYEESYQRLHLKELALRPPRPLILDYDEITRPPEPVLPTPTVIAGIPFAETDDALSLSEL